MAINLFSTSGILDRGNEAFKQGYDQMGAMRTDRTNMQAGKAYAGGDRQGAARMLAQGGNIDGARTLENDIQGDEQRAYQMQRQSMADERQAGQDEMAATQRRVEVMTRIAQGLKGVPPGQRVGALQRAMPVFQQVGIDPAMFGSLTEDQLSDEQLDMFSGEVSKSMEEYTLSPGAQRWRGDQMIADNPRERTAPAGMKYSADGVLEPIPGYLTSRAAVAGATRAPARASSGGRSGGGGARAGGKPKSYSAEDVTF
jgi:hypothetical protein